MVGILSRNHLELDQVLSKITSKVSANISELLVTTEIECTYSSLQVLADGPTRLVFTGRVAAHDIHERTSIDEVDKTLLQLLAHDSRVTFADLGSQVALTPVAVHRRITRLENERILAGYYTKLNYAGLGFSEFRVHLKLAEISALQITALSKTILATGVAQSISRYQGSTSVEFRCISKSIHDLASILKQIRDAHPLLILHVEVMPIFGWSSINYLPIVSLSREKLGASKKLGQ